MLNYQIVMNIWIMEVKTTENDDSYDIRVYKYSIYFQHNFIRIAFISTM